MQPRGKRRVQKQRNGHIGHRADGAKHHLPREQRRLLPDEIHRMQVLPRQGRPGNVWHRQVQIAQPVGTMHRRLLRVGGVDRPRHASKDRNIKTFRRREDAARIGADLLQPDIALHAGQAQHLHIRARAERKEDRKRIVDSRIAIDDDLSHDPRSAVPRHSHTGRALSARVPLT